MKRLFLYAVLLISGLTLAACGNNNVVKGNGKITTKARKVAAFNQVSVRGHYNVKVVSQQTPQLNVQADDNVQSSIITAVQGKTLVIRNKKNINIDTKKVPVIMVAAKNIVGMSLSGNNNAHLVNLKTNALNLTVSGVGRIIANGVAKQLNINVSGAGRVNTQSLKAQDVKIKLSGVGDVRVFASNNLDATVSGNGQIVYSGDPKKIEQHIYGSGRVMKSGEDAKKSSS